ncbi:MAG: hypothetical protein QOI68_4698 [Pseudonocardiales bacterium]|jgi:hypothetical protein|nr:hypothetical protein [Pseudonocardiales bacterium]
MSVDTIHRTPHDTTAATATTELTAAVEAVTSALAALRKDSGSAPVRRAIEHATATVDALGPGVTTVVLHRLIASIADCHRDGVHQSPRLAVCRRSTLVALRLDPRWVPLATPGQARAS